MSGFRYVGANYSTNSDVTDLTTVTDVANILGSEPGGQASVATQIANDVSALASSTSLVSTLSPFVQPGQYPITPRLPLSQLGNAGGVATLNSDGTIPTLQVPALGQGYIKGPYGPTVGAGTTTTAIYAGTATTTPVKIIDWNLGATALAFQPLVFISLFASAQHLGRPIVEVWINNANPGATYGLGTMIAQGVGRSFWNDLMSVTVIPSSNLLSSSGGSGYSATYNTWISAWLRDANQQGVSVATNNIANASVYLMKPSP